MCSLQLTLKKTLKKTLKCGYLNNMLWHKAFNNSLSAYNNNEGGRYANSLSEQNNILKSLTATNTLALCTWHCIKATGCKKSKGTKIYGLLLEYIFIFILLINMLIKTLIFFIFVQTTYPKQQFEDIFLEYFHFILLSKIPAWSWGAKLIIVLATFFSSLDLR